MVEHSAVIFNQSFVKSLLCRFDLVLINFQLQLGLKALQILPQ